MLKDQCKIDILVKADTSDSYVPQGSLAMRHPFDRIRTATDVPFIFDKNTSTVANYTSSQLEKAHLSSHDLSGVPVITQADDNEIMAFPVTGGGSIFEGKVDKNVGELKKLLNSRVEPDNPAIHREAVVLAARYPGDHTIDQISSIYSNIKNGDDSKKGWSYVRDPRGIDYFMYANESLSIGKDAGCSGAGDCDDFAILMSALVESVGGATRIVMSHNNSTGGHAYTEVYLGQLNAQNNQVEGIINWLKQKYNTDKIYTSIETDTKNVWLNLDWGPDKNGNTHPGGPFYQGDKCIVLCIRDRFGLTPLKIPDEKENAKNNTAAAVNSNHPLSISEDPFFNDSANNEDFAQIIEGEGLTQTSESSMSSSHTSIRGGYWG